MIFFGHLGAAKTKTRTEYNYVPNTEKKKKIIIVDIITVLHFTKIDEHKVDLQEKKTANPTNKSLTKQLQ